MESVFVDSHISYCRRYMVETCVDDWETDRAGAERLDYSRLFSAVFEMADLWCPGLAVEEYVSFLDALEFRARGALAEIDALDSSFAAARLA